MTNYHFTKLLLLLLLFASCSGERYNTLHSLHQKEAYHKVKLDDKVPTIQSGQELCISVNSLSEKAAKYFRASSEKQGATGEDCLFYTVSDQGHVELPIIGELKLKGLLLTEAEQLIADSLESVLKEPKVRISYSDFKISVLGEVASPGVFSYDHGQVTLYEALARAGGFKAYGRRDNVLVLREMKNGLKHRRLDLSKDKLWEEDYYYLQSGDVIMVSSNSGRIENSQNITSWASVFVGFGTIIAILATR